MASTLEKVRQLLSKLETLVIDLFDQYIEDRRNQMGLLSIRDQLLEP